MICSSFFRAESSPLSPGSPLITIGSVPLLDVGFSPICAAFVAELLPDCFSALMTLSELGGDRRGAVNSQRLDSLEGWIAWR